MARSPRARAGPGMGLKYHNCVAGRAGPGHTFCGLHNSVCGPGPGRVCTTAAGPGRAWASNHICGPGLNSYLTQISQLCCGPGLDILFAGLIIQFAGRARAGCVLLLRARAGPGPQIIFAGRAGPQLIFDSNITIVLRAGPGLDILFAGLIIQFAGRARTGSVLLLRARAGPGPQIIFAGRAGPQLIFADRAWA